MVYFDEDAQTRLSALLNPKYETGNTMRSDEAQAFMLAIISGPDEVPPKVWLPEILGDGMFRPDEAEEVRVLVESMALDLKNCLDQGKLPVLLLDDKQGRPDFYTWCNAYIYALDVVETDWFEAARDDDFEDLFYTLMALGGMFDASQNEAAVLTFSDSERVQMEQELPYALSEIYRYWQNKKV